MAERGAAATSEEAAGGPGAVRLGDHVAHLFAGAEERAAAAAELLTAAMGRGERGLGLGDDAGLASLAAALGRRGVDVATAMARGALQLVPEREQYLPDGAFEPALVLRAWRARTEAALAAGYTGLAVATDMGWALSGAPGVERLQEYEAAQGLHLDRHLAVMCQYDAGRLAGEALRGVVRTHALLLHGGELLRNPVAAPPDGPGEVEPAGADVARLLRALHAQAAAEAAVRRSEARCRELADGAADLVYRFRLVPEPGFDYVSPSATAMTGYTPEEHYANPRLGLELVHPDDRGRLRELMLQPAGGPILLRWVRKDGRVVWTEQRNTVVLDEAGRAVAIQGVARDVTERMEAEAALRDAEHRAGIGRLAAGVAHGLHDPIAWMGGNLRFVQEELAALEARGAAEGLGELRRALAEVVDGVERVRAIVGGLQDLAGGDRLGGAGSQPDLAGSPRSAPADRP